MKKLIRNKDVRFTYTRDLDNNSQFFLFIYNPKTGKDYVFNRMSAFIWELLEEPLTDEEVIFQIISKLNIEDTGLELYTKEVSKIINILLKQNLAIFI